MTSEKLREEIVKSLTLAPGSIEAIRSRHFFVNISEETLQKLLDQLEGENRIYKKGIRFYAYKENRLPGHSRKVISAIIKKNINGSIKY